MVPSPITQVFRVQLPLSDNLSHPEIRQYQGNLNIFCLIWSEMNKSNDVLDAIIDCINKLNELVPILCEPNTYGEVEIIL